MTDTNTSGADVLAAWDRLVRHASTFRQGVFPDLDAEDENARTAVAALIEREAALASKLEGARIACDNLTASLSRAEAERDTIAAEVKALRVDAERYRWLREYDVDSYLAIGKREVLDAQIDEGRLRDDAGGGNA